MQVLLDVVNSYFKYIFLGFNFLTLLVVYLYQRGRKVKQQHHILFVVAHPDDESMFFGPTIAALTPEYFVHLLCLSQSSQQRRLELERVVDYLGIHQFRCVKNDKLVDGEKEKWCEQTILNEVKAYVRQNGIRAIFTFDELGVSGHPNHKAIYSALSDCEREEVKKQPTKQLNKQQLKDSQGKQKQNAQPKLLKIYYLQSTNLLRKYSGFIEIFIALVRQFSWVRLNYIRAWRSMSIHSSQFVWYRKFWVLFSRYTYVNTFRMRRVCLE